MAFTTRAPRGVFFSATTTGPGVGPGSYDEAKGKGGSSVKYSIPPFSSSTDRTNDGASATPGPGYYSVKEADADAKPSSQFTSRTTRMATKHSLTPGPGSYVSHEPWEAGKGQGGSALAKHPSQQQKPVQWVKVATAPSIPATNQSYGYEEGAAGELIQGRPPVSGHSGRGTDTVGPAEYYPSDSVATHTHRGALNFGKSRLPRNSHDVPKDTAARPGPGAYEVGSTFSPTVNADDDGQTKPTSAFASTTERQFIDYRQAALPGPGTYPTRSSFKSKAAAMGAPGENWQAFGLTVSNKPPRPVDPQPGPGEYEAGFSSFEQKLPPTVGPSQTPFASTSTRFSAPATTDKQTPGPGYYTDGTTTATALSSTVHKRVSGRYGVFGTTSQRFPVQKISKALGPGAYDPKLDIKPQEIRRRDLRQAVFVSQVDRMPKQRNSGNPGVGEYNSLPPAARPPGGFVPIELRFKPSRPSGVPGPGEYTMEHGTVGSKMLGIPVITKHGLQRVQHGATDKAGNKRTIGDKAVRFPSSRRAVEPGPGQYDVRGSLIKRTFNITIGDSWD
ncbi:hypothetical protein DIPPA_11428 [Diplonema papillatum]|nr:hypothetical protein DIPPA_11428 [Diplonema papillatum]